MADAYLFQSLIQIAGDSFAIGSCYLRKLLTIEVSCLKMFKHGSDSPMTLMLDTRR